MTGEQKNLASPLTLLSGRYMETIKDQVYGNDPPFFKMMGQRPHPYGPPDPKFRIDSLEARYLPHGMGDNTPCIEIGSDGYETEISYLDRDQMQELIDGLRRICPTSWGIQ